MRNLKELMAETVSRSTAVMTIMPWFLSTPPHPHPKAVNSMQFTTFTHLSKVPPHEYGGYKISFHRRNENSETTKTEARWLDWGGQEMGLEATFPPPCSAHDTNYFPFLFLRRTTTILPHWKVLHAEFDCFAGVEPVEGGWAPVGRKCNQKNRISCNHKCISLLIQKETMKA